MSYANYKAWIRAMKDSELNDEIVKVNKKVKAARTEATMKAWGIMLAAALAEQQRRDNDPGHLLRGVNA